MKAEDDDLNYHSKINCKEELTRIELYNELEKKMLLREGD